MCVCVGDLGVRERLGVSGVNMPLQGCILKLHALEAQFAAHVLSNGRCRKIRCEQVWNTTTFSSFESGTCPSVQVRDVPRRPSQGRAWSSRQLPRPAPAAVQTAKWHRLQCASLRPPQPLEPEAPAGCLCVVFSRKPVSLAPLAVLRPPLLSSSGPLLQ